MVLPTCECGVNVPVKGLKATVMSLSEEIDDGSAIVLLHSQGGSTMLCPASFFDSVFYCAMLCKRRLCCRKMSVRPSVRLSDTRRYSVGTVKRILKLLSPSGSDSILVFPNQTVRQYFDADPLTRRRIKGV